MKAVQRSSEVDRWIRQEELAVNPVLRPIRKFDGLYPEDEDEFEAWSEWVHWCMNKDHALIMSIKHKDRKDNWVPLETDDAISFAFSSMDFQRQFGRKFDAYHYKLKKIYERVKDWGETFSCLQSEQGKANIKKRYENLVEREFREKAVMTLEHWQKYGAWMNKKKTFERIEELNDKIRECKRIWNMYAFQA